MTSGIVILCVPRATRRVGHATLAQLAAPSVGWRTPAMLRCKRLLLSTLLLALAVTADALPQPTAVKDAFGDPLPDDAVARLGTVRWSHAGQTMFAAFLPDGKTVLSAGMDKILRVWDYPSGKELRRIGSPAADNPGKVPLPLSRLAIGFAVALSPDGKTIAASFEGSAIHLFDAATAKELHSLKAGAATGTAGLITTVAFSPDGRHLAVLDLAGRGSVWDWVAGKQLCKFAGPSGNASIFGGTGTVVWSPDAKALATIKEDIDNNNAFVQAIQLWDPATGNELRTIPLEPGNDRIGGLLFAPDSKALAFARSDGTVSLMDVATGKTLRSWKSQGGVTLLLFARDGSKLYGSSAAEQAVMEWGVATGKPLRKLPLAISAPDLGNPVARLKAAWSPDGKLLVLAGNCNALQFIDVAAGKEIGTGAGLAFALSTIQFSPDGKQLFSRNTKGTLQQWDAATGKQLDVPAVAKVVVPAFLSPDGTVLLAPSAAGPKQASAFVDVATTTVLGTGPVYLRSVSLAMLFSPDSKLLAVRQVPDKQIALYEVPTGKLRHAIAIDPGGPGKVSPAAPPVMFFARDGKTLAAFADPDTLGLWDTASGERVGSLKPADPAAIQSGAFSPDGRCIALDLSDGTVALVELASGQVRRTYGVQVAQPQITGRPVTGVQALALPETRVAFGRDGHTLMHAGLDRVIHVWDVTSGQEVASFTGHTGTVNTVAVAPDGKTLASASADTTALLWDLTRVPRPAPAAKALTADQRDALWQALLDGDAAMAFAVICHFSAAPKETLALLKEKLKPAQPLDMKRVDELVAELDHQQFKVRQQAQAELLKLDERVVPAIDKFLATNPALEMKTRLEYVRKQLSGKVLQGERLRAYRAVEILERIGTAEARQLLHALAAGAPGALVTKSAQAALVRLAQTK
jgi:WD40 repeat protein